MKLSRAAFAVMIKFSEFFEDFIAMVDDTDMKWDELEGDEVRDIKMKEHLKTMAHYEQISKRWESASKMRQWVNEKKKNLIERIKKEVETEYQKKKEEDKKKKEEEKAKEQPAEEKKEEEKKEESSESAEKKEAEVEQIDTSAKKEEAAPESQGLTDQDKQNIDEQADVKFNAELHKIYEKIIEKAELLVKLQVPAAYLVKDPSKKKEGTLLYIKDPSLREGDEQQPEHEFDWKDRLKSWKQMQTSKGAIKSFTDRMKEIIDSSVMSVLACL